jgi:hypothetical protein
MRLPLTILRPAAAALPLDRSLVMRYLRYRPGVTRLRPQDEALVAEGIDMAVAAAQPAVALAYCTIAVAGDVVTVRVPAIAWRSRTLAQALCGAVGVSLMAATLGPGIEALTGLLFQREEYALATVVDAAGSALVHGLQVWVQAYLERGMAGEPGAFAPTALIGPGYGDWDIRDQVTLTDLAGGAAIGLRCTETCYLVPQKSLVGLMGWVPAGARRPVSGCAWCRLRDCPYRERPQAT